MTKVLYLLSFIFFSQAIMAQAPDFSYTTQDSLFCNPSSVSFTSTVSGSPVGYIWTFGNGTVSNSKNPTTYYSTAGTFTVRLLVIYSRTTSEVSKTITIHPAVTASLDVDRDFICTPGDINFTASASGTSPVYEWSFGDGGPVQSTKNANISHRFSGMGNYTVSMKAISDAGCNVTRTANIRVAPITISGSVSVDSGCVPATTQITAFPSIPKNSTVTNYEWDFDDGTPNANTTAQSINHTYANQGSYRPRVIVTTNEGCKASVSYKNLGFGIPPTNHVARAEKNIICGSDSAVFFAQATNANSYFWEFGDGQTRYVKENQVKYKYTSLGVKTVTVTPLFNKCSGTPITFEIEVVGVISNFQFENVCTKKETFSFTNFSQGNLSLVRWIPGDTSKEFNTRDLVHTFPKTGEFHTILIIKDSITGCADTSGAAIYTALPELKNPDTSICRNSASTFKIEQNIASSWTNYTWHVAGEVVGPTSEQSLTITASKLGSFNNFVIINRGNQYCKDTLYLNQKYVVRGPDLDFTAPSSLCFGNPYQVTNQSKPARPQDSVLLWHWNFGLEEVNDTTYQPDPYDFSRSGNFRVKLQATDIKGCTDSLIKNVLINPLPYLYTIPQIDTLCSGEAATLIAFNSGMLDWKSTAAMPCNTCDTVIVAPNLTSEFIATATSVAGCTKSDTLLIKVFPPFAANPTASNAYICLNDEVTLSVTPTDKIVEWTSSTGLTNSGAYELTAIPRETTTYTVSMRDSVGCFSSTANVIVNVKSLPEVDAGPDQVLPYNSSFIIRPTYSKNVSNYNWTPSNTLSCFSCPNPSGILMDSKQYNIRVVSDSGCIATDSIKIIVECKDANLLVPNAFSPNNDNLNDVFYPITRGIPLIRTFVIYDRYGKIVFQQKNFSPNDPTMGWDGKRNGMDQTSNVYVYYIEAECYLGEILRRRGSVTLIR